MLRAGDIIVTQWGGIALMTYPHAMLVTDVDGPEIEVIHMVASGFRTYYYYAPLQVLTAKKAKRMKIDMENDTDVVIRWRGNPEVITQVIHTAHALKGKPITYSTFAAACSVFGGDCFVDREEAEASLRLRQALPLVPYCLLLLLLGQQAWWFGQDAARGESAPAGVHDDRNGTINPPHFKRRT